MSDAVTIGISIIGTAVIGAVLVVLILVTIDRWAARNSWSGQPVKWRD